MKVAYKNELVLEKCLSHSKRVRIGVLWAYGMTIVWICAYLALGLRFDLNLSAAPIQYARKSWKYGFLQMAVVPLVFCGGYLYAIMWGTAGIRETVLVGLPCPSAVLVRPVGTLLFDARIPRNHYVLWFVPVTAVSMWGRDSFQVMRGIADRLSQAMNQEEFPRVMIISGGKVETLIVWEMKNNEKIHSLPVCIMDDDRGERSRMINGVPIMGTRQDIARPIKEKRVDKIYVATPAATPEQVRNIFGACQKTGCQVRTLPGVYQLMNGGVNISRFRRVEVEDLLGRRPVRTDLDEIMDYVEGKVALVTGGGSPIGNELYRQLAGHKVKRLVIFDIYESNTYEIQQELRRKYPRMGLVVLIGSVRNTNRLEYLFRTYRPDIVCHATAYKHVPPMEGGPCEAIKNNVMGTYKAAKVAVRYGVKRSILISTDRAVNPTNIIGVSKRFCEMVVQISDRRSGTEFVTVRFGNVLRSNGSIVPLFKRQIGSGGPVTVTHRDIMRHFMTIPEAVNLVIRARAYAKGGEIFVLNIGNLAQILDMVENPIRLSGYEPYKDIDICFIELRPGEKLYEELLMDEEGLQKTENKRIFIGKPIEMDYDKFERVLHRLGKAVKSETGNIRQPVHELAPEYHHKGIDSGLTAAEAAVGRESGVVALSTDRLTGRKRVAMYQLGLE